MAIFNSDVKLPKGICPATENWRTVPWGQFSPWQCRPTSSPVVLGEEDRRGTNSISNIWNGYIKEVVMICFGIFFVFSVWGSLPSLRKWRIYGTDILSSNIWNYMGNSTILIYGMDSNNGEYEGDMIHWECENIPRPGYEWRYLRNLEDIRKHSCRWWRYLFKPFRLMSNKHQFSNCVPARQSKIWMSGHSSMFLLMIWVCLKMCTPKPNG